MDPACHGASFMFILFLCNYWAQSDGFGTLPLNVENVVEFGSLKTFMTSGKNRRLIDCTILKLSSAVWNE